MGGTARDGDQFDVLILGPVPPPLGGISVHLSRLVPLLEDAGLRIGVLNHFGSSEMPYVVGTLRRNPLNYYRLPKRFSSRIVHYHHSKWMHLLAVALGKRRTSTRYIITLHAGDIRKQLPQLISRLPFVTTATVWALRRFDMMILVNPEIAPLVQRQLQNPRIEVLPAFLDYVDGGFRYDSSVEQFFAHGRVLVAAAYRVKFLQDGHELYGLDTLTEAFAALGRTQHELKLAIFIARKPSMLSVRARWHLAMIYRRLKKAGVRDRALVLFGLPLTPAFRDNSVFVRPTRAEGDSVSVREAQRAGVPVVASDVVRRPRGVVSFSTGDVGSLADAIKRTIADADGSGGHAIRSDHERSSSSVSDEFVRLYRAELGNEQQASD